MSLYKNFKNLTEDEYFHTIILSTPILFVSSMLIFQQLVLKSSPSYDEGQQKWQM